MKLKHLPVENANISMLIMNLLEISYSLRTDVDRPHVHDPSVSARCFSQPAQCYVVPPGLDIQCDSLVGGHTFIPLQRVSV